MESIHYNNDIDNQVDDEIFNGLNFKNPKSFFLFAGAGSGKTRSLVNILEKIKSEYGHQLRISKQQIAIITYTNAACDEITHRINYDKLFAVSTIHSFIWELIKNYHNDIREWLRTNLSQEISELSVSQGKSKGVNKSSIDRAKKIESKTKRLINLDQIKYFTYNPNSDNNTRDSLSHSEVINLGAYFLSKKALMQKLLVRKFPILLIDESQDTKKELINAFFEVQSQNSKSFSLGLFGDTMQRIYSDGLENLGRNLPDDWLKPVKKMNHRCPKRIVTLINKIRYNVDGQQQLPRIDSDDGFVHLFILPNNVEDKTAIEADICRKMSIKTNDQLWCGDNSDVQILTLENHMAARRMGFLELYEPLHSVERLKTGVLDGTLPGLRFFTHLILPLINSRNTGNDFEIARIVRENSPFFNTKLLRESKEQIKFISMANAAVKSLFKIWDVDNNPPLIQILKNVYQSGLFNIPDSLLIIAKRSKEEQKVLERINPEEDDSGEMTDEVIDAWDVVLTQRFSQIKSYYEYTNGTSKFDTHQGVKGLEFL